MNERQGSSLPWLINECNGIPPNIKSKARGRKVRKTCYNTWALQGLETTRNIHMPRFPSAEIKILPARQATVRQQFKKIDNRPVNSRKNTTRYILKNIAVSNFSLEAFRITRQ